MSAYHTTRKSSNSKWFSMYSTEQYLESTFCFKNMDQQWTKSFLAWVKMVYIISVHENILRMLVRVLQTVQTHFPTQIREFVNHESKNILFTNFKHKLWNLIQIWFNLAISTEHTSHCRKIFLNFFHCLYGKGRKKSNTLIKEMASITEEHLILLLPITKS